MQVNIATKHERAIQQAVAQGSYANPDELIDDLLTTYENEQWLVANRERVQQLFDAGEQTPIVDLTLSQLRDRMTQTIDRATA